MAIETQDVGIVLPDGSVRLEGRLPGAALRGLQSSCRGTPCLNPH